MTNERAKTRLFQARRLLMSAPLSLARQLNSRLAKVTNPYCTVRRCPETGIEVKRELAKVKIRALAQQSNDKITPAITYIVKGSTYSY